MDTSVDHLFKNGEDVFKSGGAPASDEAGPTVDVAEDDKQKTRLVSEYHRQKTAATSSSCFLHLGRRLDCLWRQFTTRPWEWGLCGVVGRRRRTDVWREKYRKCLSVSVSMLEIQHSEL